METPLFFEPNDKFVKWLAQYANGRVIFDVGSGTHMNLCKRLHEAGYRKLVAIDPHFTAQIMTETRMRYGFHVLPGYAQKYADMLRDSDALKPLVVFARPCHSGFVEEIIELMGDTVEALYITVPANLKEYVDLGRFKRVARKVKHDGGSRDGEVVYSVVKSAVQ